MAKTPEAPAAPAAPIPAPVNTAAAQLLTSTMREVVKWGNGAPEGEPHLFDEAEQPFAGGDDKTPADGPKAKAKVQRNPEAKPAPEPAGPDDATDDDAPAEGTKPKISAERRAQILANLDAEKTKRAIEGQIAEEKAKREAAEAELATFKKSPLGRKLAIIAKDHGMSVEDLRDRIMVDGDDVKDTGPADEKPKARDPEVERLLKRDKERDEEAQAAKMDAAVAGVRQTLKDVDLPLVDAFDAYPRIMATAHDAWTAEGKTKPLGDYLPEAAEIVEEELKAEKPRAAARLYPKAAGVGDDEVEEVAPKPTPRPSVGRRVAARPGAKPAPLSLDNEERDRQIMKRFGMDPNDRYSR